MGASAKQSHCPHNHAVQSVFSGWQETRGIKAKGCHRTPKSTACFLRSTLSTRLFGPPRYERGNHQPLSLWSDHWAADACSANFMHHPRKHTSLRHLGRHSRRIFYIVEKNKYVSKKQPPKNGHIHCQSESVKEWWLINPVQGCSQISAL